MENKTDNNTYIKPSEEKFKDWMAMWHVEIAQRPRHLWPNKWTITGWYAYEKYLYKKYEYKWDKEQEKQYEDWKIKNNIKTWKSLQELAESDSPLIIYGEDYFHWNVINYNWSLHKDGIWRKLLISDDGHTGICDSYEEAIATLAKLPELPKRFDDYENHLKTALQEKITSNTTKEIK